MNPYGGMNIKSLFETYCKVHDIKLTNEIYILPTSRR